MTIAGSVLLSLRLGKGAAQVKMRLIILMLSCALAIALSSLIFKFFAVRDEFWTTTFWNFAGQALFGVILMLIAKNRRQFIKMIRDNTRVVLYVSGSNELINLGGNLGLRYALLFAPLGIVQAISSTTSFFVLFFGVVLSLLFPKLGRENIGFANLFQKITAIILVVAGVLLISQQQD